MAWGSVRGQGSGDGLDDRIPARIAEFSRADAAGPDQGDLCLDAHRRDLLGVVRVLGEGTAVVALVRLTHRPLQLQVALVSTLGLCLGDQFAGDPADSIVAE